MVKRQFREAFSGVVPNSRFRDPCIRFFFSRRGTSSWRHSWVKVMNTFESAQFSSSGVERVLGTMDSNLKTFAETVELNLSGKRKRGRPSAVKTWDWSFHWTCNLIVHHAWAASVCKRGHGGMLLLLYLLCLFCMCCFSLSYNHGEHKVIRSYDYDTTM